MSTAHGTESDAWKACDLRGAFPDAISAKLFRGIGGAVATLLEPSARVLVAGDYRLSTPELKAALAEGLVHAGAPVLDAGLGPTPIAYFTAKQLQADALLMVTASHNPAAHNGLKLMLGSMPMTPEQLARIRAVAERGEFRFGEGSIILVDERDAYRSAMVRRWESLREQGKRRVVVDAGNGAWSELGPEVLRELGFEVVCLSCVPDGSFPDRSPDCARAENLTRLSQAVRELRGAIGIAWDGDGDRAAFVDEDGSYVPPDEIAILLAQANPGGKVVIDLKHSDAVRRAVLEAGGTPLLERTGHAFMRGRMVQENALLGLDACGHYFFRELQGGDDGLFSALYVLDLVRQKGRELRELRMHLPPLFSTPELRIPRPALSFVDAAWVLEKAFPDATIMRLDGLRLLLPDGVVLVRESGTEAVISLRMEGFDRTSYERICARCLEFLPELQEFLHCELGGVHAV